MSITISLWSTKQGELNRFLYSFYGKDMEVDYSLRRWAQDFYMPLDSVDMICALMDNSEKYDVSMYIHMENGYLHKITDSNYEDVIKGLFEIYYVPV
ncbi:hypothetical protein [Ruminiclostridium cellulolyticum]|uniref:Uncharacterized protein n=1 Tax=Ruminiclostridium cellulolyticum (strain ATCC 35319 / DSM 5812 / JCM 6584 / H10) TaxID=394503 RepID=B8I475_RUMCH|nr:hypothetical protein [Ruminiclostridium cellulolyticum]ACL76508.1 conserved hypothetical protein [Ruminiclostridium cellulolyticum H10]